MVTAISWQKGRAKILAMYYFFIINIYYIILYLMVLTSMSDLSYFVLFSLSEINRYNTELCHVDETTMNDIENRKKRDFPELHP